MTGENEGMRDCGRHGPAAVMTLVVGVVTIIMEVAVVVVVMMACYASNYALLQQFGHTLQNLAVLLHVMFEALGGDDDYEDD